MRPDALLLASFGGPESPDEVMPFLERVTAGRDVPRTRLAKVAEHYLALDGVSPINAQNRELLAALRAELDRRGIDLPLYWGTRNGDPTFADALCRAHDDGRRSVLAIATSAYSSYSGCRQYRENLADALAEADVTDRIEVRKARPYYDLPGFASAFVPDLAAAVHELLVDGVAPERLLVLFTTHSLPQVMAETAGPPAGHGHHPGCYERQHLYVAERVLDALTATGLPALSWQLVFQSRSGPPQVPWLEPDIGDAIRSAAADGFAAVVVVPIGFVSDHMEVVWDLDHEARAVADEVGVLLRRTATPGTDAGFVAGLVDLVEQSLRGEDLAESARDTLCSSGCCPNPRADRAAVAASLTS